MFSSQIVACLPRSDPWDEPLCHFPQQPLRGEPARPCGATFTCPTPALCSAANCWCLPACQPASNPPVAPFLRILEPALPALPAPTCSVFRRLAVLCATCTLQFSVNTDALTSCRSPTAPNSLSCNAPAPPLATGCAAPSSVAQLPSARSWNFVCVALSAAAGQ